MVDKPLIQYAVEEARAAGIEEMIFVTGRGKSAIEDHFDYSYELAETLKERSKDAELALIDNLLPKPGEFAYVRQQEARGSRPCGVVRAQPGRQRAVRCLAGG